MKKWRPLDPHGYSATQPAFIAELNQRMAELFPEEDESKPEYLAGGFRGLNGSTGASHPVKPEPAPEDPPDYSCPICGKEPANEDGRNLNFCEHGAWDALAAANRRIAQLTRERDHFREVADPYRIRNLEVK